jgi:hypothetical protein
MMAPVESTAVPAMTAGVLEVIDATELTVAAVAVDARQKEAIRRSVGFNTKNAPVCSKNQLKK